jgi:hypothetical protein
VIDLVYPLRQGGSRLHDAELRYSLRSVEENLHMDLGRLFLFGHKPSWLYGAVHIRMEDTGDKANNLREKYRRMCALDELSDPFLLLDDDHLFLHPTTEVPLYTMGALLDLCNKYAGRVHGRYLSAAYRQLVRKGLPLRNYQIHHSMLIHKEPLRQAIALMTSPMVMGSIYGNIVNGPTVEVERDFRVNRQKDWLALKDGPFVSFSPVLLPEWYAFLKERFPQPTRYEQAESLAVAV